MALTALHAEDRDALFSWINDRALVELSSAFRPVSHAEHGAWFAAIQADPDTRMFAVRTLAPRQLIGTCQLHSIDWVCRSAELQIRIGVASARGRGLGTAATRVLVDYAFTELNLHRVFLRVFAGNTRAVRAYQKAGFAVEATLRDAAIIGEQARDVLQMAIVR